MIFGTLICLTACASSPKYSPFDGKVGYWEQELAPGVYQVYIQIPEDTDKYFRYNYLTLRMAQLCEKAGYSYFDESSSGSATKVRETPNGIVEGEVVFCLKSPLRKSLNVQLDEENGVVVTKVYNPVTSKIENGDTIFEVNGTLVKNNPTIKLAVYKLDPEAKSVKVKVKRNDKTLTVDQPLEQTNTVIGPDRYEELKQQFL